MDKPIKAYSREELGRLMEELGQPAFRATQLLQWLYAHHARSYDDMTNLPASLRETLRRRCPLETGRIVHRARSHDGTRKYLVEFADGVCVETVAIPAHDGQRLTVCFSTQAGCPMACLFCATGAQGLTRSLVVGEMVDQVLLAQEDMGMRVSNLVAMGQGEPFLNYEAVLAALRIMNNPDALSVGARRMTVSTCGILEGIRRLSREPEQFTLAVSLHAATQEKRDRLMPKVSTQPLGALKAALRDYIAETNRRVTFEYAMIAGLNDSAADLDALCAFCSDVHCHVNLIPLNRVPGSPFKPSPQKTMLAWKETLTRKGSETTIRESRGADIEGACGQLRNTRHPSR